MLRLPLALPLSRDSCARGHALQPPGSATAVHGARRTAVWAAPLRSTLLCGAALDSIDDAIEGTVHSTAHRRLCVSLCLFLPCLLCPVLGSGIQIEFKDARLPEETGAGKEGRGGGREVEEEGGWEGVGR